MGLNTNTSHDLLLPELKTSFPLNTLLSLGKYILSNHGGLHAKNKLWAILVYNLIHSKSIFMHIRQEIRHTVHTCHTSS